MTQKRVPYLNIGGVAYGPVEIMTLRAELIPMRDACLGPDYLNAQGAIVLSHVIGLLHELPKLIWPTGEAGVWELEPQDIEKVARIIAHMHGAQIKLRRNDETLTVAAIAGFGSFGHSPEKYAAEKWPEYVNAAKAVVEFFSKPEPKESDDDDGDQTSD